MDAWQRLLYLSGMATYKLIQDIEADDKILGPLTLRQFLFALVMAFFLYLSGVFIKNGLFFMLFVTVPPALFFAFFAFPFGRDQPTELWALGKLNFMFKPRVRIWNQSGVKELVTVTVPKKVEHVYTDGLSQGEVHSRLAALANTIDSRGWAVKHVDVNVYTPHAMATRTSDRLIDPNSLPQEVPSYDVTASDDMMDTSNNPIAQQFDSMIDRSTQERRQQLIEQLNSPMPITTTPPAATGTDAPWFMNNAAAADNQQMAPVEDEQQAEAVLSSALKAHAVPSSLPYGNLRTLWPLGQEPPTQAQAPQDQVQADAAADTPVAEAAPAMTASEDPAILALANNDDLNVATLAREAQRVKQANGQEEVVISLH